MISTTVLMRTLMTSAYFLLIRVLMTYWQCYLLTDEGIDNVIYTDEGIHR